MVPITVVPVSKVAGPAVTSGSGGHLSSFGSLLGQAVQSLSQAEVTAHSSMAAALDGKASLTQVMVSMTQAQSDLDVATAFRNGAVSAYQTIMNMPLG